MGILQFNDLELISVDAIDFYRATFNKCKFII